MKLKLGIRKVGGAFITLLLASLAIFMLIRFAPGDPINMVLGTQPGSIGPSNTELLEAKKEAMREQYGLNHSLPVQFVYWLGNLATFNLGQSIRTGNPIIQELGIRIPATLLLSVAALSIQAMLGLLLGIYSALKSGKIQDSVIRFVCVLFASLPAFVLSLLLLFIFAVQLRAYEISSAGSIDRLWLPALTLGLVGSPQIIRMVRANMLAEMGQIYVSSSVSLGLSKRLIVGGAFRNALLPIITTIALSFAHLVGGAVVIESIFTWPGVGSYAMNSILVHDYPAVQGYTVLTVATVILINLFVEISYIWADPRIRGNNRVYLKAAYGKLVQRK